MKEVRTIEALMEQLSIMRKKNSVCQVFIPGIGNFTIELQEEDSNSTALDTLANPYLKQKVNESTEADKERNTMSASELERNPFL